MHSHYCTRNGQTIGWELLNPREKFSQPLACGSTGTIQRQYATCPTKILLCIHWYTPVQMAANCAENKVPRFAGNVASAQNYHLYTQIKTETLLKNLLKKHRQVQRQSAVSVIHQACTCPCHWAAEHIKGMKFTRIALWLKSYCTPFRGYSGQAIQESSPAKWAGLSMQRGN